MQDCGIAAALGDTTRCEPASKEKRSYYTNYTIYELDTEAIFGELYRQLNESTKLSIGLRFTSEQKQIVQADQTLVLVSSTQRNRVENWDEVTGRIGVDHRFGEDAMVFANISRGYKSGGLNPPSFTGAFPDIFEPEYVNSFEIGLKSTIADGRAQANLTYFFYDYKGLQTSKIVDRTSVNENIDARLQGLEFEFIGYASEALRFDITASGLGTEVISGRTINNADPSAGQVGWTTIKDGSAAIWIAPIIDINGDGSVTEADAVAACDGTATATLPSSLICGPERLVVLHLQVCPWLRLMLRRVRLVAQVSKFREPLFPLA